MAKVPIPIRVKNHKRENEKLQISSPVNLPDMNKMGLNSTPKKQRGENES